MIQESVTEKVSLEQKPGSERTSHLGVRAKRIPQKGRYSKPSSGGWRVGVEYLACLVNGKEASVIAASVQEGIVEGLGVCSVKAI